MKQLAPIIAGAFSPALRRYSLSFVAAAVLAGSGLPPGSGALALGVISAAGHSLCSLFALCGAATGAFLLLDFPHGLRTLAAGLLIFTASRSVRPLLENHPSVTPLLAAVLTASVEFVYALQDGLSQATTCLLTVLFAGISAALLRPLFAPQPAQGLALARMSLLVGALLTFSRFELIAGVLPARLVGLLAILLAAYCRGCGLGGSLGLALGLCLDLSSGSSSFLCTAVCGLGGLLGGLRCRCARAGAALFFLLPPALLLLTQPAGQALPLLYEAAWAALCFLLIPTRQLRRLLRRTEPAFSADQSESRLRERLQSQLSESAAAFRELYQSLGSKPSATEENPSVIFDRAAEQVCRPCTLCRHCWEKEYSATYTACNDATALLLRRGRALGEDFPPHFAHRCLHFAKFLAAVNGELAAYQLRRRCRAQVAEARQSAQGQLEQLSELLTSTAGSLGAVSATAPASADCRLGAAIRPKQGQGVSGDSLTVFQTTDGRLCLLLSDGMGSGEAARRESAMAVRLLERFLQAGVEPVVALKTLNAALSFPNDGHTGFTTVDLLCLELKTGAASLYKYGAAPTYLMQGGRVQRVTCSCLPAGLLAQTAPPEHTALQLHPGALLVMVTDGLSSGGLDDVWLQDLLARWEGGDPQALATWILAESRRHGGLEDDCGVLVLSLPDDAPLPQAV